MPFNLSCENVSREFLIWHRYTSYRQKRSAGDGVIGYDPYQGYLGSLRRRRHISDEPRRPAYISDDFDWSDLGEANDRLYQSSRVLRAKKAMRRQFELYGPPLAIYEGLEGDRYNFPTFKPAYQWSFPGFGRGYGSPYRSYVPGPYFPQYY